MTTAHACICRLSAGGKPQTKQHQQPAASGSSTPARQSMDRSREAEERRAAYLAALEEREADRRALMRHNSGLAGSCSGWGALSFLPYLV